MNLPAKPSRIDFENIDLSQLSRICKTGEMDSLTDEEKAYFSLMDVVRGMRARLLMPGGRKIVTKAGIIKMLRTAYGVSDWMARRIYDDALNFFYSESSVAPRAWSNLYADKLEKMADLAFSMGKFREARALLGDAAKHRGCFDASAPEIPEELLRPKTAIVYSADARALGAPAADRAELAEFIDSLPEVPEMARSHMRQDAGIEARDMLKRMMDDVKEFAEDAE